MLFVFSIVLVAAAPSGGAAVADDAKKDLRKAETHWRNLDYELVVDAADRAASAADATPEIQIEAWRLKGSALVVLNRQVEAIAVFEKIFALAPDYELPEQTSPRVLSVFLPHHPKVRLVFAITLFPIQ